MTQWLPSALFALFSFGLWGFFTKLAVVHIDAKSALVFQTVGVLVIGIITLSFLSFKPATDLKGLSYGLLTGLAYGVGCLFYFLAVDRGKLMTVVTLTALYPIVTIALSYFLLKETINFKQSLGIGLAVLAIYLLSS